MYKWIHHKNTKVWNYWDPEKGCAGLINQMDTNRFIINSPTKRKSEDVWEHDFWGEYKTLTDAKNYVENKLRNSKRLSIANY